MIRDSPANTFHDTADKYRYGILQIEKRRSKLNYFAGIFISHGHLGPRYTTISIIRGQAVNKRALSKVSSDKAARTVLQWGGWSMPFSFPFFIFSSAPKSCHQRNKPVNGINFLTSFPASALLLSFSCCSFLSRRCCVDVTCEYQRMKWAPCKQPEMWTAVSFVRDTGYIFSTHTWRRWNNLAGFE